MIPSIHCIPKKSIIFKKQKSLLKQQRLCFTKMKRLIFFFIFLASVIGGLAIWWNNGIAPVHGKDSSQKIFVIEKGQGIRETANALKREGLIRDPIVFFLLVKKMGI